MSRLCRLKTKTHGEDGQWAYEEIVRLREQVAAQAAVIESLKSALTGLLAYNPEQEWIGGAENGYYQTVGTCRLKEIQQAKAALAIPTNSTQILAEVRRAEREKCAEWQPIETAPKNGAWALVYADGAVDCAFVQYGKTPDDWTKPTCPNVQPEYVTHWMPLPNAPQLSERWSE